MGAIRNALTSSKTQQVSSKRVAGWACIVFAMVISSTSYFMSDKKERDIPENVRLVSLQFILTGGGLLGLGLLEKKEP